MGIAAVIRLCMGAAERVSLSVWGDRSLLRATGYQLVLQTSRCVCTCNAVCASIISKR